MITAARPPRPPSPKVPSRRAIRRVMGLAGALLLWITCFISPLAAQSTWDGSTSTDWSDSTNWSAGVPDAADTATIPGALGTYPILTANSTCLGLNINSGASVAVGTFTLTVAGDVDLNGTLTVSTGTVDIAGTFDGGGGTLTFSGSGRFEIADSVINWATTWTASTSTVKYKKTTAGTNFLKAATYYNVETDATGQTITCNGSSTITNNLTHLAGTLSVSGTTLTVNGNADFDGPLSCGTGVIDVDGTFDATGTTITFSGAGRLKMSGNVVSLGTVTPGGSTIEYDDTANDRTVIDASYNDLEIDCGARTASLPGNLTLGDDLVVTGGTLAVGTYTLTVPGNLTATGTITISTGKVDMAGVLDATGGSITFTGAGTFELSGNSPTSFGTFTPSTSTVLYNRPNAQTAAATTYYNLTSATSGAILTSGGTTNVTNNLSVTAGTFSVATTTVTVTGATDVDTTLTIGTGTLDANGSFDATGGAVTFNAAGRLQLGSTVTSLGTFTRSSSTVEYDSTSTNQTIDDVTYTNLEIDNSGRVATTGGSFTVIADLTVTSGEIEIDDATTLQVDDDVDVFGTFDVEPGATLKLASTSIFTVKSGGTFEAIGTHIDLAQVTSSNIVTPQRYAFTVDAGGVVNCRFTYFRYVNSSGINITDNGSVVALTDFFRIYMDNGPSGGKLLSVTANDNVKTLQYIQFFDTGGNLADNMATTSSTAALTIDPYDSTGFGGPANENDNGGGTVTPGYIIWGSQLPVRLERFEATRMPDGNVLLEWETAAEWEVLGFRVERSRARGPREWTPVGQVAAAAPSTPGGAVYRLVDDGADPAGAWTYRLVEIDALGMNKPIAEARPIARARREPAGLVAGVATRELKLGPPEHFSGVLALDDGGANPALMPAPFARAKISVDVAGVIRVSQEELATAGLPADVDPALLALAHGDEPWPVSVIDGGDRSFDPGDAIELVAPPFESTEAPCDIYWLTVAAPGDAPLRIPERDGSTPFFPPTTFSSVVTKEHETDAMYVLSIEEGAGRDHWFASFVLAPDTLDISFDVAPNLISRGAASLELELEGWSSNPLALVDHQTRVLVNGTEIGELTANGAGPYGGVLEVPVYVLVSGSNVLTLEGLEVEGLSLVYVNRFVVRFVQAHTAVQNRLVWSPERTGLERIDGFASKQVSIYRTSGPGAPERLTGALVAKKSPVPTRTPWSVAFALPPDAAESTFEATTPAGAQRARSVELAPMPGLAAPDDGADYIAIAPRAFHDALTPLLDRRRDEGLRVTLVALEDIDDVFAGGRASTDAIRAFLADAWENWTPPSPRFVLLAGDATYDPSGHLGMSPRQVLPTRLVESGVFETASDLWFGDVAGDDEIPEMAIGRLPAATAAELEDMVANILAYEDAPSLVDDAAVFVADEGADFIWMHESIAPLLPESMSREDLSLDDLGLTDLRERLFDEWNGGARLVQFTGHGGLHQWSTRRIIHTDDIPLLAEAAAPPVVIAMSCLNGFFHHPGSSCLGEEMLRSPGGAAAYWGSTSIQSSLLELDLSAAFYAALFDPEGDGRIGSAITAAVTELAQDPERCAALRSWVLLGDPAMVVP